MKQTKKAAILALAAQYPKAKPRVIAKTLVAQGVNVTAAYVSTILYQAQQAVSQPRQIVEDDDSPEDVSPRWPSAQPVDMATEFEHLWDDI